MISEFVCSKLRAFTAAVVFGLSLSLALAQAAPAAGRCRCRRTDAPSTAPQQRQPRLRARRSAPSTLNRRFSLSNEGQRDFAKPGKKFEPKQNELKGKADEIDSLKKQLNAQQDKLNEESRDKLVKQIETKQKSFRSLHAGRAGRFPDAAGRDRQQDPHRDGPAHREVRGRQRLRHDPRHLATVAARPGDLVRAAVDITEPVIEAFNVQSGVAPPPAGSTPKPVKPAPNEQRPRPRRLKSSGHRSGGSGSNFVLKRYLKTACRRGLYLLAHFS